MTEVVITFKIMPEGVETDLEKVAVEATKAIADFGGEVGKKNIEPVAFGLKSLNLIFVMDEAKGSTDSLEAQITEMKDVKSVEVTDVRRALG